MLCREACISVFPRHSGLSSGGINKRNESEKCTLSKLNSLQDTQVLTALSSRLFAEGYSGSPCGAGSLGHPSPLPPPNPLRPTSFPPYSRSPPPQISPSLGAGRCSASPFTAQADTYPGWVGTWLPSAQAQTQLPFLKAKPLRRGKCRTPWRWWEEQGQSGPRNLVPCWVNRCVFGQKDRSSAGGGSGGFSKLPAAKMCVLGFPWQLNENLV